MFYYSKDWRMRSTECLLTYQSKLHRSFKCKEFSFTGIHLGSEKPVEIISRAGRGNLSRATVDLAQWGSAGVVGGILLTFLLSASFGLFFQRETGTEPFLTLEGHMVTQGRTGRSYVGDPSAFDWIFLQESLPPWPNFQQVKNSKRTKQS